MRQVQNKSKEKRRKKRPYGTNQQFQVDLETFYDIKCFLQFKLKNKKRKKRKKKTEI